MCQVPLEQSKFFGVGIFPCTCRSMSDRRMGYNTITKNLLGLGEIQLKLARPCALVEYGFERSRLKGREGESCFGRWQLRLLFYWILR